MLSQNKIFICSLVAIFLIPAVYWQPLAKSALAQQTIDLPSPGQKNGISLEAALANRNSVRKYADTALSIDAISQLLWAAQGITDERSGGRTAPSAGALYPMKIHVAIKKVNGLKDGVYSYMPLTHSLKPITGKMVNNELAAAALGQMFIARAPAVFVLSVDYSITTRKYQERGIRYVHMEAGHVAQNIYLQAESLGLGTVSVGAFLDKRVEDTLELPPKQTPLYIMPVGIPGE